MASGICSCIKYNDVMNKINYYDYYCLKSLEERQLYKITYVEDEYIFGLQTLKI